MICMSADALFKAEAELLAQRVRALGLTQAAIAAEVGASQSQVSRVLSGTGVRRSKLFDRVCKYVYTVGAPGANVGESGELMEALAEVWDGSHAHAKALALVIRSLGGLGPRASAMGRSHDRSSGAGK
jgi:transcriptional regulator with XRE-family HTH domain